MRRRFALAKPKGGYVWVEVETYRPAKAGGKDWLNSFPPCGRRGLRQYDGPMQPKSSSSISGRKSISDFCHDYRQKRDRLPHTRPPLWVRMDRSGELGFSTCPEKRNSWKSEQTGRIVHRRLRASLSRSRALLRQSKDTRICHDRLLPELLAFQDLRRLAPRCVRPALPAYFCFSRA